MPVDLLGGYWDSRLRHACEQTVRDRRESLTHVAARTADAVPWLGTPVGVFIKLLLCAVPVYGIVAMQRVFERSWARTVLRAAALSVIYVVLLGATVGAVFVYAMLQL